MKDALFSSSFRIQLLFHIHEGLIFYAERIPYTSMANFVR